MVALPSTQRLTYTFDAVGQRNYLVAPTGGRFTTAYDAAQRIVKVQNPEGDRTSYVYDNASRRTAKYLANGTRASFSYDNANQLTTLANLTTGPAYVSRYDYKYDPVGNRAGVLEVDGSRVTNVYDKINQLLAENRTGTAAYRNTFTFDSRGNRLVNNQSGARTTTTFDAANQIVYSAAAAGRTTYQFDSNGNTQLVKSPDGTRVTTTWSFENQPTRYLQSASTTYPVVTMLYNGDKQRVEKDSPVATTRFIWDNQNYLAEADGTNTIQTVYTNERKQYGRLISTRLPIAGTSTSFYHHFDAVGSTRQLSTSAGAVSDTVIYDAWGNALNRSGSTPTARLWVGALTYYTDPETGLVWILVRPFGPATARWTTADPLGLVADRVPYRYVRNNPATRIDPSGLKTDWTGQDCFRLWFNDLELGKISKCAMKKGCVGPINCRCCPIAKFDAQYKGPPGQILFCTNNWNKNDLSEEDVKKVIREELFHAITLCYGWLWNDRDRALSDLDNTLKGANLTKEAITEATCLAEEMLAQYCAGACQSIDTCLGSADKSCRGDMGLVGAKRLLGDWFDDEVEDACRRIRNDCGFDI